MTTQEVLGYVTQGGANSRAMALAIAAALTSAPFFAAATQKWARRRRRGIHNTRRKAKQREKGRTLHAKLAQVHPESSLHLCKINIVNFLLNLVPFCIKYGTK